MRGSDNSSVYLVSLINVSVYNLLFSICIYVLHCLHYYKGQLVSCSVINQSPTPAPTPCFYFCSCSGSCFSCILWCDSRILAARSQLPTTVPSSYLVGVAWAAVDTEDEEPFHQYADEEEPLLQPNVFSFFS